VSEVGWCAAEGAVAHVFVERLDDNVMLDGADGHHLQRVRRLRAGELVTAADGSGAWRRYEVGAVANGRLDLVAIAARRVEPELVPPIGVALALTKGGLDHVVARVTELGVTRIEPIRMLRSVVRWDPGRATRAVARLQAIARESAAQSRRARVPEVRPPVALAELVDRPDLVIADRSGGTAQQVRAPGPAGWTVLVGPEGGFDPVELASFPTTTPRLAVGPHVLRAETAPVAAVAALRGRGGTEAV
jgi:16S rRNA (uracil1498-N3)-methyltransferase